MRRGPDTRLVEVSGRPTSGSPALCRRRSTSSLCGTGSKGRAGRRRPRPGVASGGDGQRPDRYVGAYEQSDRPRVCGLARLGKGSGGLGSSRIDFADAIRGDGRSVPPSGYRRSSRCHHRKGPAGPRFRFHIRGESGEVVPIRDQRLPTRKLPKRLLANSAGDFWRIR